ncbi:unnamed protein product [Paramecium primaurelia]|uniref:Protein kinase domain-containing protein n=1 Tax=Paramecium primaurelia TaxID=5886 RepID=A0A8S1P989_PARPR|nr:unnamed protein product [Paramecium primaurelia]
MKNDFQEKIQCKDQKNYEKLLDEQINLCQDEENRKYILGIDDYQYNKKQNKFKINYNFNGITQNISQEAKSLSQVQLNTLEEKLNIFDQLLELAKFLKKKKIIHNNIQKNNLILYKNKLYLTDFGYLQGQQKSNMFMDQKNFVRTLNKDQQRQIYPYQSQQLLEILDMYYLQNEELMQKLEQRKQEGIQENDQHVLTVLMFEIFYHYDKDQIYDLKNSLSLSKKANRNYQLKWMIDQNPDVQDYLLIIIQQILKKRFIINNELSENFPKSLSGCIFQIDRKRLINIDNLQLVQEYFENKIQQFDQESLYCFTYKELQQLQGQIQNSQNQFEQDLKQEIEKIQKLYDNIDKKQFNMENFKQLELEEKFICLVYLDQKIDDFDFVKNQDQSQEVKKLLDYYNLKQELKEFYTQINKKQQQDFKFNVSIMKQYMIQFEPLPQQINQSLSQSQLNTHYKIDRERLLNIDNQKLVQEYFENKIQQFDQESLYCFTYKELQQLQGQIQNSQNQFEQDLKQEIEKIQKLYDNIDKKQLNMENFKQLELEEKFICLVYLDQKIDEFDINQNQDQSQEVKKLLDYYTLKQELKEFYDEVNLKQQQDFKFNDSIMKQYRIQFEPLPQQINQSLSQSQLNTLYKIDREKLINIKNKQLVQKYIPNEILEFVQQLLYYFTYKEIKKILNQFQNPQNQFEQDLKQEIEKIQKLYNNIDNKQLNKENFKQLELEKQFICLVYLDQKIDEFNCNQNQVQSQDIMNLLDYYTNLKYELKEFYFEINHKQQKDFKFNIPTKYRIIQIDKEKQKFVQVYNENKILVYNQVLLYCFTNNELQKILNQFQNPQNQFEQDLKQEIEKILKLYNNIDNKQLNKENFKQLELEKQFICLVYLDQKIDEFDIINNQDKNSEVNKLLYYYTLKYELKEFYDQVQDKIIEKFNFKNAKNFNDIRQQFLDLQCHQFQYESIICREFGMGSDLIYVYDGDYINDMKLDIQNQSQLIIHKFLPHNNQYYCQYLKVEVQRRNFEPKVITNFNLIKEYWFEEYNSTVRLIDHKKKFKYYGEYQLDEQGEIKFNGQGTKEILEKDKQILQTGQVFKVKGNFKNNQLNGKSITFYHHYDESKITFSIGEYKDGQMSGQHIHYPVNDEKIIKTTLH